MSDLARTPKQIGNLIRRARKKRGLNQTQLGERAGLRQETISLIETGNPATKLETILAVLAALDLELRIAPRSKGAASRHRGHLLMPRRRAARTAARLLNNRLVGHLSKEAERRDRLPLRRELARLGARPAESPSRCRCARTPIAARRSSPSSTTCCRTADGLRRRVAERVGAAGIDAYSLLAAIGHDCVGALQFIARRR